MTSRGPCLAAADRSGRAVKSHAMLSVGGRAVTSRGCAGPCPLLTRHDRAAGGCHIAQLRGSMPAMLVGRRSGLTAAPRESQLLVTDAGCGEGVMPAGAACPPCLPA